MLVPLHALDVTAEDIGHGRAVEGRGRKRLLVAEGSVDELEAREEECGLAPAANPGRGAMLAVAMEGGLDRGRRRDALRCRRRTGIQCARRKVRSQERACGASPRALASAPIAKTARTGPAALPDRGSAPPPPKPAHRPRRARASARRGS